MAELDAGLGTVRHCCVGWRRAEIRSKQRRVRLDRIALEWHRHGNRGIIATHDHERLCNVVELAREADAVRLHGPQRERVAHAQRLARNVDGIVDAQRLLLRIRRQQTVRATRHHNRFSSHCASLPHPPSAPCSCPNPTWSASTTTATALRILRFGARGMWLAYGWCLRSPCVVSLRIGPVLARSRWNDPSPFARPRRSP